MHEGSDIGAASLRNTRQRTVEVAELIVNRARARASRQMRMTIR